MRDLNPKKPRSAVGQRERDRYSFTAMAEAFFSLYCLVKNTLPPKVFFKFFKDLDLFFIYPKTAPNALWQCAYILQVSEFYCT